MRLAAKHVVPVGWQNVGQAVFRPACFVRVAMTNSTGECRDKDVLRAAAELSQLCVVAKQPFHL